MAFARAFLLVLNRLSSAIREDAAQVGRALPAILVQACSAFSKAHRFFVGEYVCLPGLGAATTAI